MKRAKKYWKVKNVDLLEFLLERGTGDNYKWWLNSSVVIENSEVYVYHTDLGLKNGYGEYGIAPFSPIPGSDYFKNHVEICNDYEYMGEFISKQKLRKLKLKKLNK